MNIKLICVSLAAIGVGTARAESDPPTPSAGRNVWSQNSAGYINTVADLGPHVKEQVIKLRLRMGSDASGSGTGWRVDRFAVTPLACPPTLVSAVSRKVHGGAGAFDINLPLTGSPGIECRTGAIAGTHQIVLTFANSVAFSGASLTAGTGSASASVNGNEVTVNLAGITNAQIISVTLANADDGANYGDVSVSMAVLSGDTSGDGSVNATDISKTRAQSGRSLNGANFRPDVNASGSINATDIGLVKSRSGTAIP